VATCPLVVLTANKLPRAPLASTLCRREATLILSPTGMAAGRGVGVNVM